MRTTLLHFIGLGLLGVVVACSSDTAKTTDPVASGGSSGAALPPGAAAAASTGLPSPGVPGSAGTGAVPTSPVGSGTAGSGSSVCPPLRPVEDAACTVHSETCTYDEIACLCPAGSWACSEPVDPNCPATMPVHNSVCTVPEATECEFLQDECECVGGLWTCESAEVAAEDAGVAPTVPPPATTPDAGVTPPPTNVPPCPDLRPIEGLSCEVVNRTCLYDTTACQCPSGTWLCNESVDPTCPIEPPIPDSACNVRADCDYFNIECECTGGSWNCKAND
ncbi:MAG: hypothetical protein ABW321_31800 [Polyangiales bacterium]